MTNKKNSDTLTAVVEVNSKNKRDLYIAMLDTIIDKMYNKATAGRIKNTKNENIRINYYRSCIYAINVASGIIKDKQMDKIEDDLNFLKNSIQVNNNGNIPNTGDVSDDHKIEDEIEKINNKFEKLQQ